MVVGLERVGLGVARDRRKGLLQFRFARVFVRD
jgi:hypothetical protein